MHPKRFASNQFVNWSRIDELAFPKERSDKFIPDKPSPYWLDYVIDTIPQTIKDSKGRYQYYQKLQSNMPRLSDLAKPKTAVDPCADSRPKTSSGIPLSALNYEPTERIKQLAEPRCLGQGDKLALPDRKSSTASKARSSPPQSPRFPWKKESTDSTKIELGKGDFPNRSNYRIGSSSSKASSNVSNSQQQQLKPKLKPQVHVHNHVTLMHQQKNTPFGTPGQKPLRVYAHSTTAVSRATGSPVSDLLQINRSYAASKVNIRRAETADNMNINTTSHNSMPRFVRSNPMSMKYAPKHSSCTPTKKPFK